MTPRPPLSREAQRAVNRHADQQTQRLDDLQPNARVMPLTVKTVTLGAATDGGSVVTLTWREADVTAAAYITPHVPIAGDRFLCCYVTDANTLYVLGRLGGFPPEQ